MSARSFKLGAWQVAGLECHLEQPDLDTLDLDPGAFRLSVADGDGPRVADLINEAADSADAQYHERMGEPSDEKMATALANLSWRVRKATRGGGQ